MDAGQRCRKIQQGLWSNAHTNSSTLCVQKHLRRIHITEVFPTHHAQTFGGLKEKKGGGGGVRSSTNAKCMMHPCMALRIRADFQKHQQMPSMDIMPGSRVWGPAQNAKAGDQMGGHPASLRRTEVVCESKGI